MRPPTKTGSIDTSRGSVSGRRPGSPRLPRPAPPARPTGAGWRQGRDMLDAVTRGMRVFDDYLGQGTVLSVVPQERKTEVLVRFDTGRESWRPVFFLLVEDRAA